MRLREAFTTRMHHDQPFDGGSSRAQITVRGADAVQQRGKRHLRIGPPNLRRSRARRLRVRRAWSPQTPLRARACVGDQDGLIGVRKRLADVSMAGTSQLRAESAAPGRRREQRRQLPTLKVSGSVDAWDDIHA